MRRLVPDGIAARFALILAAALAAAMLIALVAQGIERSSFNRAALMEREIERVRALVPALEALPGPQRAALARDASSPLVRVTVGPHPLAQATSADGRARMLAAQLAEGLGSRAVAVETMDGNGDGDGDGDGDRPGPRPGAWRLSVRLAVAGPEPVWLNLAVLRMDGPRPDIEPGALALVFVLSLVAVLAVGLAVLRQLTRPIAALAAAAQAAGRGDRSARVAEQGPREIRAAAAAFNDMQVQIARFEAERMRTLGAVGHDLRTPITSLRIRAEMIDDDETRDAMVRTLDEMAVMANGLVGFARGTHEDEEMQDIALPAFLARLAAERGASFAGGPALAVRARPVALGRAIGNLVDNALRYGGSAELALARADGMAEITVADSGPGLPPERLETVFAPFVRGDDSRSLDTGGAGLGLSIAQAVVVAHGGSIALENRRPQGLIARVRLPLAAA